MGLEPFEGMRAKLSLATLGKPALVGLAALVIMVAVLAGRNLIGTATANEFELSGGNGASSEQAVSAESHESATVFVHVSGAVVNPGLYELEEGSRLAAAIEAAGGFAQDALPESVNLARRLEDGEMVHVGSTAAEGEGGGAAEAQQAATSAATGAGAAGSLVNINTATQAELESLPGIGPATAAKIVEDRKANGAFRTVDDLTRVSGVGERKLEALDGLICV